MTIRFRIDEWARLMSEQLRPPRRHVIAWVRWRFTQQPRHMVAVLADRMSGDVEPTRTYGMMVRDALDYDTFRNRFYPDT